MQIHNYANTEVRTQEIRLDPVLLKNFYTNEDLSKHCIAKHLWSSCSKIFIYICYRQSPKSVNSRFDSNRELTSQISKGKNAPTNRNLTRQI